MHAGHRQEEIRLDDGSRMVTCTKRLRRGARTAMLQFPGLMRVDVIAHDDAYAIRVRKLCSQRLTGGLATVTRRDEGEQQVSSFHVERDDTRVDVSVTLPANAVGDEVPCSAIAHVRPR